MKSADGKTLRVNLEIAINQSSFIAEYIENEKAEYEDQIEVHEGLTLNEISINLAE